MEEVNIKKYYSEFSFLRNLDDEEQIEIFNSSIGKSEIFKVGRCVFYYSYLAWDSNFFGLNTIRINFIDCPADFLINDDLREFEDFCKINFGLQYVFIEIPSEHIDLIQNLNLNNFRLIETRLHYYNDFTNGFTPGERFNVRAASNCDIDNLRSVAARMRNIYDRFHADRIFDVKIADAFLAKYIENAINGFADLVIVPNALNCQSNSFLTAVYQDAIVKYNNLKCAKMVLSAVDAESNKGWYLKLISEMTIMLREKGFNVIHCNTQATNRAVIKVWTKLGYQYGRCTHIFSKKYD